MDAKQKKNIIVTILQDWYVIDQILFENDASAVIKKEAEYKEYVALKGTMLSNLFEFLCHIDYRPENKSEKTVKILKESSVLLSSRAKTLASNMLSKDSIKKKMSNIIMTEAAKYKVDNMEDFSDKIINEKFYQIALDNVLVGMPLLKCQLVENTNNFRGQVIEESHRSIRNAIIRLALTCEKN